MEMDLNGNSNKAIWIGVAVGTAIGVGIALSRRKQRDPWNSARGVAKRVASRSGDISDATKDLVERIKNIYEEGLKVVEDANELWAHGRKVVGV
jgi:hypothetical protein